MDRRQLEEAIVSARRANRSFSRAGLHAGAFAMLARRAQLRFRARTSLVAIFFSRLVLLLRNPGPLRALILSAAALATGVLGIVVAYAVVPQEGVAAPANGVRIVTITGPDGTRTVAVTTTKQGTTRVVPVRVLRTVTGPEGVRTIAVTGPSPTDTEVITQVRHSTETEVVTEIQPVTVVETDVVTQPETVVVTETVVETETQTVVVPPGQP